MAGWTGANSVSRGPFVLNRGETMAENTKSTQHTLPEGFIAADGERATHGKLKARHFRFRVYETADPEGKIYGSNNSYGCDLAEIGLMKDGARVNWPVGAVPSIVGASALSSNNSKPANLCNNVIWEEKLGNDLTTREHCMISSVPCNIVIDAGEEMEFDSYSFVAVANNSDCKSRIPKAWTVQVSDDGTTWHDIDVKGSYTPGVDYTITTGYQAVGPFPVADKFPLLDRGAGDSLGDCSPVAIAEGATLKLATDYEKFGALSGAGTLELESGAVGEINACAAATFGGKVTGKGTLAVTGEGTQTFDGADLSGVETLELNGGAIAGTATFGGKDVTLAFNGGALGATLSRIGKLTVTGDVKYAVPLAEGERMRSLTVIEGVTLDEATQDAFRAGTAELPRGWTCDVTVDETSVKPSCTPGSTA